MDDAPVTLEAGAPAPDFEAVDSEGNVWGLDQLDRRTVVYFYPKDDTPGCTVQACDFRDHLSRLHDAGLQVLGVSRDSEASHERFRDKFGLTFPLLIDSELEMHKAFGVWREKTMYGKTSMGCVRSTFVISSDHSLEWVKYNVRAEGHVTRLLTDLGVEVEA